jgi:hypothetical protein
MFREILRSNVAQLDWFQRLASADLAPAAICQIKSEERKET